MDQVPDSQPGELLHTLLLAFEKSLGTCDETAFLIKMKPSYLWRALLMWVRNENVAEKQLNTISSIKNFAETVYQTFKFKTEEIEDAISHAILHPYGIGWYAELDSLPGTLSEAMAQTRALSKQVQNYFECVQSRVQKTQNSSLIRYVSFTMDCEGKGRMLLMASFFRRKPECSG